MVRNRGVSLSLEVSRNTGPLSTTIDPPLAQGQMGLPPQQEQHFMFMRLLLLAWISQQHGVGELASGQRPATWR